MAPRNRTLELLKPTATLNGVDFVEVREDEPNHLYVHFINAVAVGTPTAITITGGDLVPTVAVAALQAADWSEDGEGRPVLRLTVLGQGDHSSYTLRLVASTLDPYLQHVAFSFFVWCPSVLDCQQPSAPCLESDEPRPAIDYLAKDYDSFRRALSDFSRQRYPEWQERGEADLGSVLLEALSAVGDQLSYIQDRWHLQAQIETATERDAIVQLARLVDYEPTPVLSAYTELQCDVASNSLPAGVLVTARAADGSSVPFETGTGIRDDGRYRVSPKWNSGIEPYWWDDDDRCLPSGATAMDVVGHQFAFFAGQRLLLDTSGPTAADAHERQIVTLRDAGEELDDPLFGQPLTRIRWRPEDALTKHRDLTRTTLAGNLLPATQGLRRREVFAIHQPLTASPHTPRAVARLAPNSTASAPSWLYRYTLSSDPLAFLPGPDDAPVPEVVVTRLGAQPQTWTWTRSLLDAGEFEDKFTIDPGSFRVIAQTAAGTASDYDGSHGATLRFGTGMFASRPLESDVFEVRHRESRGAVGRVPADSVTLVDSAWAGVLLAATNPFPARGGADAETDQQVRERAPHAFRASTRRAVRREDYNAAATRLPWVQRAGTVFRWTGSWTTVLVTADPKGAGSVSRDQHRALSLLLNRYRLAGYEAYAPAPVYVSFDIEITVCAESNAFRGDVQAGIERALSPRQQSSGKRGFFHFDNFSLGTPFERSRLESAIQQVPGVAGVLTIKVRRRGKSLGFGELPGTIEFGAGEIFRMDNDKNRPERGSYTLDVCGGK